MEKEINPIIEQIKEKINFREFLENHEGHSFSGDLTLCPFHDDKKPSMQIKVGDKLFYCHSSICGAKGDVIEYVCKKHKKSVSDAILYLADLYNLKAPSKEKEKFEYIYKDANGEEKFKKVKIVKEDGAKEYDWQHKEKDIWISGSGGLLPILYNLDKFKDAMEIIICEGEKDANNVNSLGFSPLATSAPFGMKDWDKSLTENLKDIPICYFCYDLGNEQWVGKHATEIKNAYQNIDIYIISVPGEKREDDITDFLETFPTIKEKKKKFLELLGNARERSFEIGTKLEKKQEKVFWEDLVKKHIPEIEYYINPYIMRKGLIGIGGTKFSHKSFFAIQSALHLVSGVSPFLKGTITKKFKVLIIQQELTEYMFRKRIERMLASGLFGEIPPSSLALITTTGKRIKINHDQGYDEIKRQIENAEPDVAFFDPFYTFHTLNQNLDKEMNMVMDRLATLKESYNMAVVFTHHFTSKKGQGDPTIPIETSGFFKGSTVITDPLDVVIALKRLLGQKDNLALLKPWEDYNEIEIDLRDGERPKKFETEFDASTFLLRLSNVWQEIGRRISSEQILELLESHEGSMTQPEIIEFFKDAAGDTTIKRSLTRTQKENLIRREKQGKIIIWHIIKT